MNIKLWKSGRTMHGNFMNEADANDVDLDSLEIDLSGQDAAEKRRAANLAAADTAETNALSKSDYDRFYEPNKKLIKVRNEYKNRLVGVACTFKNYSPAEILSNSEFRLNIAEFVPVDGASSIDWDSVRYIADEGDIVVKNDGDYLFPNIHAINESADGTDSWLKLKPGMDKELMKKLCEHKAAAKGTNVDDEFIIVEIR